MAENDHPKFADTASGALEQALQDEYIRVLTKFGNEDSPEFKAAIHAVLQDLQRIAEIVRGDSQATEDELMYNKEDPQELWLNLKAYQFVFFKTEDESLDFAYLQSKA